MKRKNKILVVDDIKMNRQSFIRIFEGKYEVLEAEDGQEALEVLHRAHAAIAVVVLDLVMPVMNGFEFLEEFNKIKAYENIPVVVSTTEGDVEKEKRCLELGAWDFVPKSAHPDIVLFRIVNAIQKSRVHLLEYDRLTEIYNQQKFYQTTRDMLDDNSDKKFAFIRMDIDQFKMVNAFYGIPEGDHLISQVGGCIASVAMDQKCCTYGRIYADIFGICMAFENVEEVFAVAKKIRRRVGRLAANYYLKLSSGIYVVEDNDMNMADIYDRATLASHQSKGKYMVFETLYTKEMGARIVREQLIINEMDHALKNQEFVVYYQPKYEVKERSPKGAEALVRWKKPDGTMVSPGEFIPIFEKNGFITKLDYYMWEKVCQFIKRQLDAGMEIDPISANVSRVNLYNPKFLDSLIDLVEKYKIPPRYLHLELTESAFSEDVSVVQNVIKRLHKVGFTILMDDFGSAYSSLNVLKDIQMDVLKIDMKFLSHGNSDARGRKILEAIINMAVSLDMPVIAEGVEEEAQVEMLERLGCNYIQGYYFARPMPEEEYVKLITEKSMQSGSIQKKAAIE